MKGLLGSAVVMAGGVALVLVSSCSQSSGPDETRTVEKSFAAGGRVGIQIENGDCEISRAGADSIRVTVRGNVKSVAADVNTSGTDASVIVKNTPHNNFHCTIDVPEAEELRANLGGGNLIVADVASRTSVENVAGNTEITVGDPADYGSVDASVGAGDLRGGPFGGDQSGIGSHVTWSGTGKRTLTAHVGAGNLALRK